MSCLSHHFLLFLLPTTTALSQLQTKLTITRSSPETEKKKKTIFSSFDFLDKQIKKDMSEVKDPSIKLFGKTIQRFDALLHHDKLISSSKVLIALYFFILHSAVTCNSLAVTNCALDLSWISGISPIIRGRSFLMRHLCCMIPLFYFVGVKVGFGTSSFACHSGQPHVL